MNKRVILSVLLMLFAYDISSQNELLDFSTLSDELKKNANAVVRSHDYNITLQNIKSLNVQYKRVVAVLNEKGMNHIQAYLNYSNTKNINKLKANIYDKNGVLIEKVKRSDFVDVANVSEISLYEDDRLKYLDYTPSSYPFTVEFSYEITDQNTAYLPFWYPVENYLVAVESSSYEINFAPEIGLNIYKNNLEKFDVSVEQDDDKLVLKARNIPAIRAEHLSPDFSEFSPVVMVSPKKFYYEGYQGQIQDWQSLGKWMYQELLTNRSQLPETTVKMVKSMVEGIEDPIERAKVIYDYVQENTRYISVQEGIGGIQPIDAMTVDAVKYGDCKGLTNYTKALMDVAEVESYYTRVYGDRRTIDVHKEFVSFLGQTNHVILNIPNGDENVWLECTSQKVPFGHIANFTDDRNVLVITPDGGIIQRTKAYSSLENKSVSSGTITLDENGNLEGNFSAYSQGVQYSNKLPLADANTKDLDQYYKNVWDYINGLILTDAQIRNKKNEVLLEENIDVYAENYVTYAGEKVLLNPNVFNRFTYVPPRYTDRKLPFKIERGYIDEDVNNIKLSDQYTISMLPESIKIDSEYGSYEATFDKIDDRTIEYKRRFELNKGFYEKGKYKDYRSFRRQITKADKTIIVLIKNK